jgi:RNA polymerase sigma-70 factor, ECF subfamily
MAFDYALNPNQHDTMSTIGSSLLGKVREINTDAWDEMVKKFFPLVYSWCRRDGLSESDSADVCQDVFKSVLKSIGGFQKKEPTHSFRGWLRRITQRRIIDFRSTNSPVLPASGGNEIHDLIKNRANVEFDSANSNNSLSRFTRLQSVLSIVAKEFEPLSWQAFVLSVIDEIPGSEVAETLGLTRNSVYLAKSRILKRIRELYSLHSESNDDHQNRNS